MAETRADRLRKARKAANFKSASEAARSLGVSPPTYIHHENGTRDFDQQAAELYARRYHVTVSWLMLGDGEMRGEQQASALAQEIDLKLMEEKEYQEYLATLPPSERTTGRTRQIESDKERAYNTMREMHIIPEISPMFQRSDSVLKRGWVRYIGLEEQVEHNVVANWGIPKPHLEHELGATPRTILFPIVGDANSPTLVHGDLVFVDPSVDDAVADGLYLISSGNSYPQVRRLEIDLFADPKAVTVTSDKQPAARQSVSLDSVSIIGKVVGRISRL